jgi:hypothetical protein
MATNNIEIDEERHDKQLLDSSRRDHWIKRNYLYEFLMRSKVDQDECDNKFNALGLITALILTIPFSLLPSLDYNYWQSTKNYVFDNCGDDATSAWDTINFNYPLILNNLGGAAVSAAASLSIVGFYYTLKPSDIEIFNKWWKVAKYAFVLCLLLTITSVVCIFDYYIAFEATLISRNICTQYKTHTHGGGSEGMGFFSALIFISLLLMFPKWTV